MTTATTTSETASTETMSKHDEFWHTIKTNAEDRIESLFDESDLDLVDIIGGDGTFHNYLDAKKALAYVLCHSDNSMEKACGILSICEWVHACNELRELASTSAH